MQRSGVRGEGAWFDIIIGGRGSLDWGKYEDWAHVGSHWLGIGAIGLAD